MPTEQKGGAKKRCALHHRPGLSQVTMFAAASYAAVLPEASHYSSDDSKICPA
jgi:hypothetical protein